MIQRSNEKQWLIKQISFVKEQKERDLDVLNKDYESSEKSLIANFSKRINEKNEEAKVLGDERDEQERQFMEQAEEESKKEIERLESYLS